MNILTEDLAKEWLPRSQEVGSGAASKVLLAQAYARQFQHERALRELRAALELDPRFARANFFMGVVYTDQGRYDEAAAACRAALELDPNLADAHLPLGRVLGELGEDEEAIASCERAVALKAD
ncbi:MAG: tetratricopeptide repeat protein, partial [Candidatus Polarisedimenticolia bacterium]